MDTRQLLKTDIDKYIQLTAEEFDTYYQLLRFNEVKKKQNLHTQGKVCREAFFILRGCIRYYNLVNGEEHTGQFFFEGSWYSDYASFLFEQPSDQIIQALEPTQVAMLSKRSLEQLYVKVPKFERFGRIMAERAFLGLRKRTHALTQSSAQDRYADLVKNRPEVIQRIPQKYIASYLGIKPQSLSRIRSSILLA